MLVKGMTITIPEGDRMDATGPTELQLTENPPSLHARQEWITLRGVVLDDGFVTDGPVRLLVRAAFVRELATKAQAARTAERSAP